MVDELQAEMDRNEARFVALRTDMTTQMDIIKIAKGRYMMLLAEVISNLNADQSEQAEKEVQRQQLDSQYYIFMSKCKKRIKEITCDEIVPWLCIRDAIMCEHSITALTTGGINASGRSRIVLSPSGCLTIALCHAMTAAPLSSSPMTVLTCAVVGRL